MDKHCKQRSCDPSTGVYLQRNTGTIDNTVKSVVLL